MNPNPKKFNLTTLSAQVLLALNISVFSIVANADTSTSTATSQAPIVYDDGGQFIDTPIIFPNVHYYEGVQPHVMIILDDFLKTQPYGYLRNQYVKKFGWQDNAKELVRDWGMGWGWVNHVPMGYKYEHGRVIIDPNRLQNVYSITSNPEHERTLKEMVELRLPKDKEYMYELYQPREFANEHFLGLHHNDRRAKYPRGWYSVEALEQNDPVMAKEQTLDHAYKLYARMEEWKLAMKAIVNDPRMRLDGAYNSITEKEQAKTNKDIKHSKNFSIVRFGLFNNFGRSEAYGGKQTQKIWPDNNSSWTDEKVRPYWLNKDTVDYVEPLGGNSWSHDDGGTQRTIMNMVYNQKPGTMLASDNLIGWWGNTLSRKMVDLLLYRAPNDDTGVDSGVEIGYHAHETLARKEHICRKNFILLFGNSENYAQHFRKHPLPPVDPNDQNSIGYVGDKNLKMLEPNQPRSWWACHHFYRLNSMGLEVGENKPRPPYIDKNMGSIIDGDRNKQHYFGFRKNLAENSCFPTWHEGDSLRHITKAYAKEDWLKLKLGVRNPRTIKTFVIVNPTITPKSFEYFQRAGVGIGTKTINKGPLTAPYNHTFNEDVYVVDTSVTPDKPIDQQDITKGDMYKALSEIFFDKILPSTTEIKVVWDDEKKDATTYAIGPAATISSINSKLAVVSKTDAKTWSSELILYKTGKGKPDFQKVDNQKPNFKKRTALLSYLDDNGKLQVVTEDKFVTLPFTNWWFGLNTADITVGGSGPAATQSNKDEWKEALIPWITRSKSDQEIIKWAETVGESTADGGYFDRENRKDSEGTTFGAGSRDMSDAVTNPIVLAGKLGDENSTYPGYPEYLITSANDSMIYLFKKDSETTTSTNPYSLALNYVPLSMEKKEETDRLAKHYMSTTHSRYGDGMPYVYLQNGGMRVNTIQNISKKGSKKATEKIEPSHIFLSSTMGMAARGALALNVAGQNPYTNEAKGLDGSDWTQSVPLFETPKGKTNLMGYTIGAPSNGMVIIDSNLSSSYDKNNWHKVPVDKNVHMVTFVSSGFNHHKFKTEPKDAAENNLANKEDTALYIYETLGYDIGAKGSGASYNNYKPGKLIRKISIPEDTTGISGGGLAEPVIVDINNDRIMDIAYAGDRMGNMYRFDLRSTNPENWSVTKIFSQTDRNKPISSAPNVSVVNYKHGKNNEKYMVLFGTGSDLFRRDIINNKIHPQTFYGIVDDVNELRTTPLTPNDLATRTFKSDPELFGPETTTATTTATATTVSAKRATEIADEIANNNGANLSKHGWKLDLFTDHVKSFEEKVTTRPSVVIETVMITTKILPKIRLNLAGGKGCQSIDFTSQSRFIQLDAQTGGKVKSNSAVLSYKSNVEGIKNPSAYLYDGLSSLTIIDTKYDGAAISADGVGSNDGIIAPPEKGADHGNKTCIGEDSGPADPNTKKGITNDSKLSGPACDGGKFRRVSWREIF